MCFCASASFGLGATLLPAGAYCVAEAARKDRAYLALGAIPLVFAAQQLSEGFVWLGLAEGPSRAGHAAVLTFLFFALVFWGRSGCRSASSRSSGAAGGRSACSRRSGPGSG